jgi:hypothetical protein
VEFYVLDFCAVGDIIHFDSFRDILYTLGVDKLPKPLLFFEINEQYYL